MPATPCLCPICNNPVNHELFTKGVVRAVSCSQCNFVFADPSVWRDPYSTSDYYSSSQYKDTSYPLSPSATDRDRIRSVQRLRKSGKLLDLGGGLGTTAIWASQLGFTVTLLEDSELAVRQGSKHHPDIEWLHGQGIPDDIATESFDVVTMFHVLEHIPNPRACLRSIHRILKPGGILCIEVPNWGSNFRKLRGKDWAFVLDHHVNYFDKQSLGLITEAESFTRALTVYRRTFAINEAQKWKEPLKAIACSLGFGDIIRCVFTKKPYANTD